MNWGNKSTQRKKGNAKQTAINDSFELCRRLNNSFRRCVATVSTVAALSLTGSASFMMSQSINAAPAQSPNSDLTFDTEDMDFILKQIEIAERHAAGEKLIDILPNASIPWGLRTVDGSGNNLLPGQQSFGQADAFFVREVKDVEFRDAQNGTSYGSQTSVFDSTPRLISHLISNQSVENPAAVSTAKNENGTNIGKDIAGSDQFFIPNTGPDAALSAPFNAFMTFFGQFFDHGLDLISKGGNGVVVMAVPPDDPLFDPTPGAANMMVMPRATQHFLPGPDGVLGTPDDVRAFLNATTPHVDQQQTYGSHASAQILLRHYISGPCPDTTPAVQAVVGCLQSSGRLLNGFGNDRVLDTEDDGGMATWDTAQAQGELKLGLILDDQDGNNVPMILADPYGNFIPGPLRGLPQLVTAVGENGVVTGTMEGDLENPIDATQALRVNHSFFLDVAHSAAPGSNLVEDADDIINPRSDLLSGQVTRGIRESSPEGFYDDELLGVHFVCGDGRCNENIALTTIHSIFHAEHNRLVDVARRVLLDARDLQRLNAWLHPSSQLTELPNWQNLPFLVSDATQENQAATHAAIGALNLDWNGSRMFQVARFGTEMQYNRIVFDEFAPTLSGLKDAFAGFHTEVDPSISLEFAQSVYRFGHSMLTQTVNRLDPGFNPITDTHTGDASQLGLFEAFLNPLALYNAGDDGVAVLSPEAATGAVVRGLVRTASNEIDEFVTGAMQNNLVGLPLDLGAINIARGRDVGNPSLNEARRSFFAATQDTQLKPYAHWLDYGDNIRHEPSLVNFIAAYGKHESLAGLDGIIGTVDDPVSTYNDRRAAACAIVGAITPDPVEYCIASGFVDGNIAGEVPIPIGDVQAAEALAAAAQTNAATTAAIAAEAALASAAAESLAIEATNSLLSAQATASATAQAAVSARATADAAAASPSVAFAQLVADTATEAAAAAQAAADAQVAANAAVQVATDASVQAATAAQVSTDAQLLADTAAAVVLAAPTVMAATQVVADTAAHATTAAQAAADAQSTAESTSQAGTDAQAQATLAALAATDAQRAADLAAQSALDALAIAEAAQALADAANAANDVTSFQGTVSGRGRLLIQDTCPAGLVEVVADAPGVNCFLRGGDRFRCRGVRLQSDLVVTATCLGEGAGDALANAIALAAAASNANANAIAAATVAQDTQAIADGATAAAVDAQVAADAALASAVDSQTTATDALAAAVVAQSTADAAVTTLAITEANIATLIEAQATANGAAGLATLAQAGADAALATAEDAQATSDVAAATAVATQTAADAAVAAEAEFAAGGARPQIDPALLATAQATADAALAAEAAAATAAQVATDLALQALTAVQAAADAVLQVTVANSNAIAAAIAATAAQATFTELSAALAATVAARPTPADAQDFLYGTGNWASGADGLPTTGVEDIDFWIGGLAEERMPFGGLLGSTHNFVFEHQIESLQNGDRFYYVTRTANIHLFGELESNSFSALAMRNTDLGATDSGSIPLNIFLTPDMVLEVDQSKQFDAAGDGTTADPTGDAVLTPLVIRDAAKATTNVHISDTNRFLQLTGAIHATIGGTDGDDTILGGIDDETIYGKAGNDRIDGGDGPDHIEGGPGDDIITDLGGPDVIEGGSGNDAISSGNEEDVIFGDSGNDFIVNSSERGDIFAGLGDDYILDGIHLGHIRGGAGDDWMENLGGGEDLFQADNGAAPEAGEPIIKGNDVFISHDGNNDADMENGDDIVVDGPGIDRVEGQLGFDWVSFANDRFGVTVDLGLSVFMRPILPPSNATVQNRYDRVEGVSGSPFSDIIHGTPNLLGTERGNELTLVNMALIEGLEALVPATELRPLLPDVATGEELGSGWFGGDIILGGGGSDILVGEGGNDIIDGDASLKVAIRTPDPVIRNGPLGHALRQAQSAAKSAATQLAADLVALNLAGDANGAARQALIAAEVAVVAADDARIAALNAVNNPGGDITVMDAFGALIAAATTVEAQPETGALTMAWKTFLASCQAALSTIMNLDTDLEDTTALFEVALMDLAEAAERETSTRLTTLSARVVSSTEAVDTSQLELDAAQQALDSADRMVLVPGMQDVMGAIFEGFINPGELSISRVISLDDVGLESFDSAVYSGSAADYTLTFPIPGVLQVTDNRGLVVGGGGGGRPVDDGRDLLRNVERLLFSDAVVCIGIVGPDGTTGEVDCLLQANIPASGLPVIEGVSDVGATLMVSSVDVTDPDNVTDANPTGSILSMIDWAWQVELNPRTNIFTPLKIVNGLNGNGDLVVVHGKSLVLSVNESGLRVRVQGIFKDDKGVFERVTSAPVQVSGNIFVDGPGGIIGIVDLIAGNNATVADLNGLTVEFANNSGLGVPRFDITITDVPLNLFTLPPAFAIGETAGCGAANDLTIVCAGDEVAVTGFTTSFFDANGNLIRTFAEDNVQVVSQEVLDANGIPTVDANGVPVVRQDVAWILFSIRFGDVTALVPGASTVEVSLNGVLLASATFTGDSAVNNAQDVVIPSVRNGSLNAVDATIVP